MTIRSATGGILQLASCAGLVMTLSACATRPVSSAPPVSGDQTTMTHRATGAFEVKLAPQPADDPKAAAGPGRMTIDKQFHGDLEATSIGQMLAYGTEVTGSAGYVAMEKVTGTLAGRTGSFALQHSGTMDRGTPSLTVTVVPDSGTGDLVGLKGRMNIIIDAGKHRYEFDYSLPALP